jgi:hypothetical protein
VAAESGARVIWLVPYLPDYLPIELMWSKIKTLMRAAKARTREELERALLAALELVTRSDCRGWFGQTHRQPLTYPASPHVVKALVESGCPGGA